MATRPRSNARRRPKLQVPPGRARPAHRAAHGAKRTVMYYVRQLPQYLRLLAGSSPIVVSAMMDKLLVVGAIAYIIMPIDFIPGFIPFFGEIDDVYHARARVQRLSRTPDGRVGHWTGDRQIRRPESARRALRRRVFFRSGFADVFG